MKDLDYKKSFWGQIRVLWHPQKYDILIILGFCVLVLFFDCCAQPSVKTGAEQTDVKFTKPEVPSVFTTVEQRAEYLLSHYWDNFNFSDTILIGNAEVTEQAFVDYINLFSKTSSQVVEQSINAMLNRAILADNTRTCGTSEESTTLMFSHFVELYEKYLYEPNSPFRHEEYYLMVLRSVISNNNIDELLKIRPVHQMEMAMKNRQSEVATDFEFMVSNGRTTRISKISADYIILFFNNPDCHDCARVKHVLSQSVVIQNMMLTGSYPSLRVVSIYPDEDLELWRKAEYPRNWINGHSTEVSKQNLYDLRAIPNLYLLDKSKRVLLKDARVEVIIDYLQQNLNNTNKGI